MKLLVLDQSDFNSASHEIWLSLLDDLGLPTDTQSVTLWVKTEDYSPKQNSFEFIKES